MIASSPDSDQVALFEQLPAAVVVFDLNLVVTRCNPRFAELVGSQRELLVGQDFNTSRETRLVPTLRQALEGHTGIYQGPYVATLSGRTLEVWCRTTPLRDATGKIVGGMAVIEELSERKRASDAIRRSEERFGPAVPGNADGQWEYDCITHELFLSSRFRELLGYRAAEGPKTGTEMISSVHPDDLAGARAAYQAHFARRYRLDLELRIKHRSGSWRWIWVRGQALWDSAGRPIRIAGSATDITERRESQEASQRSEALFFWLSEQALVGTYVTHEQNFIYANKRFAEMLGRDRSDVVGHAPIDFLAADPTDPGAESLRLRELEAITAHYTTAYLRPDGVRVDMEIYRSAFELAGGRFVIATALDISERRRSEEALRASEDRYRKLVELSPEPVFVHVKEQIVFANAAAAEVMGVASPEVMHGRSALDAVHRDMREHVLDRLRRVVSEQRSSEPEEQRYRRADGTWVYLEVRSIPFTYAGEPAVLSVARDITRRRALEEELRLSQKQEAVGQLAGGIAHDFNNLLAVIISSAELALEATPPDSPQHADIGEIFAAATRAAVLTRQLLAFSRKQPLRPRVVNLNAVVREAEKLLRRVITENIAFRFDLSTEPLTITADPIQLEQVLMNLTVNARDAMPDGGTLDVETRAVELDAESAAPQQLAAGRYVRLSVRDTGDGMDEATRVRVFEPFFTTKEVGKGTGLGLSTVYGIVRQSGGHIEVSSTPGHGSSFVMLFPASLEEPTPEPRPVSRKVRPAGDSPAVLLVEDEPTMRAAVRRMLRSQGFQVLEAANGEEALRVAASGTRIALLLTDLVMPEMGGLELTRRLRVSFPEIKVLFMSGYSAEAFQNQAEGEPGAMLLQKPFTAAELSDRLAALALGK